MKSMLRHKRVSASLLIWPIFPLVLWLVCQPATSADSAPPAPLRQAFSRLPLRFEANRGQTDRAARFLARGDGYTFFLTDEAAIWQARAGEPMRLTLVGAQRAAQLSGEEPLAGRSHYLIGNEPAQWHTQIEHFASVRQRGVWPGIDLVWHGRQQQLEHDFIVAPGAEPRHIRLAFSGAQTKRIDGAGALLLQTGSTTLRLLKPVAWQEQNGVRQPVTCAYRLNRAGEVELQLGAYDRRRTLVIDPVITLATWIGGAGTDVGSRVTVDKDGNIYLAGVTASIDFPLTPAPRAGDTDIFVLKLTPDGQRVSYATYLGGFGEDSVNALTVDAASNLYLAGQAAHSSFPVTVGAAQSFKGERDAFIVKLDPTGAAFVWSTMLGGAGTETANALALDAANNVFVSGRTTSSDLAANGVQTGPGGSALYRSANSGGDWSFRNNGLTATTVYGVAVSPFSANSLFAVTERGLYRSSDGGARWQQRDEPNLLYDVAIDPVNPLTHFYLAGPRLLLKTVNQGQSFENKIVALGVNETVYCVLVDPSNAATVYAGTSSGAFKSVNGGESWQRLPQLNQAGVPNAVTRLIADPNNPAVLYAGTYQGVYKSTNGGANWSLVLSKVGQSRFHVSTNFPGIRALALDPARPATLYAGANLEGAVYKSTDAGATWTRSDNGLSHNGQSVVVNALAVDPNASSVVYAGTNEGIYQSSDGGANWQRSSRGLLNQTVFGLAVDRRLPGQVLAGTLSGADAFAAKLNANGAAFAWLSYLGGALEDAGAGIAVDQAGNAYVTGLTGSADFPVARAFQPFGGGAGDAFNGVGADTFVSKLNPAGTALVWSSFLGGSDNERARGIAVNAAGEAFVAGEAYGYWYNPGDAFLHKLRADGGGLLWTRLLDGNGSESVNGIALDPLGNPFVVGRTNSVDFFPLRNTLLDKLNGTGSSHAADGFVAGFDGASAELLFSSWLGGNGEDSGNGLAFDARGNLYVAGSTTSGDFPKVNSTAPAVRGTDAFLVKISQVADLALNLSALPERALSGGRTTLTLAVSNQSGDAAYGVTLMANLPNGFTMQSVNAERGACNNGNPLVCELGGLAAGATVRVQVTGTLAGSGSLTVRASVSSQSDDPNTANNAAQQNIEIATLPTIFGRVLTPSGNPVGGVTMTLNLSSRGGATTRGDGSFQFPKLPAAGNYIIAPVLPNHAFIPASQTFNNLTTDRAANFTAIPCVFNLAAFKQSFPATGGTGSVLLTSPDARCSWTARSNASWLTLTSAASGNGTTTMTFNVAPTISARTGTLTLGGQTFTVTQEFNACGQIDFNTVTSTPLPAGQASSNFSVRDFNADGVADLVFLLVQPDQPMRVTLLNGKREGGFAAPVTLFTGAANDGYTALRAGDLSGDGKDELVLAGGDPSGANGRVAVLLNDGAGGFKAPTIYRLGPGANSVELADFNNDGKLDLAVGTGPNREPGGPPVPAPHNVSILLGTGAGNFDAPSFNVAPIDIGGVTQVAAGDFNNDGLRDVAVMSSLGRLGVLYGDGSGKLILPTAIHFGSPGSSGTALAAADFNGDGQTDLALAGGQVFLAVNGAFGAPKTLPGVRGASVIAEDLNNDGRADLAFSDDGSVTLLFSRGNGEFAEPRVYLHGFTGVSGFLPRSALAAFAASSAGRVALYVVGNPPGAFSPEEVGLAVLALNRNGTLAAPHLLPPLPAQTGSPDAPNYASEVQTADFNGDGHPDLAGLYPQGKVGVSFGNGVGEWAVPVGYKLPSDFLRRLQVRDFNRDGKLDLAALSSSTSQLFLLFNDGVGQFNRHVAVTLRGVPADWVVEDFNHDGSPDFVVTSSVAGLALWLGDGAGRFTESASGLAAEFATARVAAGDFNGDGNADLAVWSGAETNCTARRYKLLLLYGDGRGGFNAPLSFYLNLPPGTALTADVNGDGRSDLVYANACLPFSGGANGLYTLRGAASASGFLIDVQPTTRLTAVQGLSDLNGDGLLDVVATQGTAGLAIFTGKGDGTFNAPQTWPWPSSVSSVVVGDFNADGANDLIAGYTLVSNRGGCLPAASLVTTSAASFRRHRVARAAIAAAFGANLATETRAAASLPLPTNLAGVTVRIKDRAGSTREAPLFFVSPNQINYLIPPESALGEAVVSVTRNGANVATGVLEIAADAPGLFTVDASGQGFATGVTLRVRADGAQVFEPIARFDPARNRFVAIPIDLSNPAEQLFLILFGTGWRRGGALGEATALVGDTGVGVQFAGAQGSLAGLDQLNLVLPRNLVLRGEVEVQLTVSNKAANPVRITFK